MTTVTITLSEKQIELLKLLEQGYSQKQISGKMEIGIPKVKYMIHSLCAGFSCSNATQLVSYAIRNSII